MNSKKGFVVPIIIAIVAILAIGGVFFVTNNKKVEAPVNNLVASSTVATTTDETKDWKTYTDVDNGFEFKYPSILSQNIDGKNIILSHSINYTHPDVCDFRWDAPDRKKLVDFDTSFKIIDKNLKEYIQSSDFPGWDYVSKNPFSVGSLTGYKIEEGLEGCGNYIYYFPISLNKTLIVTRSIITEFTPIISNYQTYVSLPGVIIPSQEENYLNQILSTFKFMSVQESLGAHYNKSGPNNGVCTPNWTCSWGACSNGYQGMVPTDSNNCAASLTSTIDMVCPALARVCIDNSAQDGFTSPQKDSKFNFGDTILIKWNPTLVDASTIVLICTDSTECSGNSYQIYTRQDINDRVSIDGSLSYVVPLNYSGPTPGKYRAIIYSYGQKSNIKSEEFSIIPPPETAPKTDRPAYIQDISGQENKYYPGEPIEISVDARDYNGMPASPDIGFNIQAHIFDANNYPGNSFQAVNASYDEVSKLWKVKMNAPTDKSLIYNLQISLYCGYVGLDSSAGWSSVCAQEHGTNSNSQLDKTISFVLH